MGWKLPHFPIQYSPFCSNGRMTWVHEGRSTSRAKSCPSPRHRKGSEKTNGPSWQGNFLEIQQNQQNGWKVYVFLIFLISSLQKESQFPSFFSQTRGLSASLLFAALGPMSKEQLEVLWPSGAVISPDMFFLKTAKLESEYQISINIPEGSRR